MALALCRLAAVLLVAATGIEAAPQFPAPTTTALTPEASPFVVNGDFSKPLAESFKFTEVCSDTASCPATDIHLVKSNGNFVAQIDSIASKCSVGNIVYSILQGTIKNLLEGETYVLGFDYTFSANTDYDFWDNIVIAHASTSNPKYTKTAKGKNTYTFKILFKPSKSGSASFSLDYFNCPYQGTPPPDVQLDNFRIMSLDRTVL